jgi:hypothetical protein
MRPAAMLIAHLHKGKNRSGRPSARIGSFHSMLQAGNRHDRGRFARLPTNYGRGDKVLPDTRMPTAPPEICRSRALEVSV